MPETIRNGAVRVRHQNGVLYFRNYGGQTHMVVTSPERAVLEHQAFDSGLVTQYPLELRKKQFEGALIEAIRPAVARLDNLQASRSLTPATASEGSTEMAPSPSARDHSTIANGEGQEIVSMHPEVNQQSEGAKMLETRTPPPASVQDGAAVGNGPKVKTQESTQAATPPDSHTQSLSSGTESQGMKTDVNPPSQENRFTLPRLEEGDSTGKEPSDLLWFKDAGELSPELQTRVDTLKKSLEKNPRTARAAADIRVKEYARDTHLSEQGTAFHLFTRSFERLTGKKVVFIDTARDVDPPFSAVVNNRYPNTIFVHIRANRSAMALIGHEWLHTVRLQDKALYRDLQSQLLPLIDNWKGRAKELSWYYPRKELTEELTANIVGDAFAHPDFWRHLSEQNRPLFERLVESVKRWFASFQGKAHESEWGTEAAFENIEAVHKAVMSTLEEAAIAAERDPARQRAMQAEEWAKVPAEAKQQLIRDADAKNLDAKLTGKFTEAPSILKQVGKDEEGQPQDVYHVLHEDGSRAYSTTNLRAADKVRQGLVEDTNRKEPASTSERSPLRKIESSDRFINHEKTGESSDSISDKSRYGSALSATPESKTREAFKGVLQKLNKI